MCNNPQKIKHQGAMFGDPLHYVFRITTFFIFWGLFSAPLYAQTTDVIVLNNTSSPMTVVAGEITHTIEPFARETIWQVERDTVLANGQVTTFDLNVANYGIDYQLTRTGRWIGSDVSSRIKIATQSQPQPDPQSLDSKTLIQLPLPASTNNATLLATTTSSYTKLHHDEHLAVDELQPRFYRSSEANHLSIITYNTQLMPLYAGTYNKLNNPGHRAEIIPEQLKDYDIVVLQELYDRDYRATMTNLLEQEYPYHTNVVSDGTSNLLTGGVMIFSRWPLEQLTDVTYTTCEGIDCLAAKGGQLARITKGDKDYYVVGTHVQSEETPSATAARQEQLLQLRQMLDAANVPATAPVILAGDLNVDLYAAEYADLQKMFPHAQYNPTGMKYTYDAKLNSMVVSSANTRQFLDYLVWLNGWQQPRHNTTHVRVLRKLSDPIMWPDTDLSDHFAVEGYFIF